MIGYLKKLKYLKYIKSGRINSGYFILIILFLLLTSIFPIKSVLAHQENQPAFLKINHELTSHYKIRSFSVKDFVLPQDSTAQRFEIGQSIQFSIDPVVWNITKDMKKPDNVLWNFGDGANAVGFNVNHTYQKPGSYLLTIKSKFSPQDEHEALIESLFINVLPDANYQFPEIVLFVNGQKINDGQDVSIDFSKAIILDAQVQSKSSKLSYYWDLGNGKTTNDPRVNINYESGNFFAQPILRVNDNYGLIADYYFKINNSQLTSGNEVKKPYPVIKYEYIISPIAIFILVVIAMRLKKGIDK